MFQYILWLMVIITVYQALRFLGLCCLGSVTLIKKRESKLKLWMFLVFPDPNTQGFQKLVLYLSNVHFWLTSGLKSVRFKWYLFYFSWKWKRSPFLTVAQDTNKNHFSGRSLLIYLNKYKHCWDFFYDQTYCCLGDNGHEGSKVWCKLSEGKSTFLVTLY